MNKGVGDFSALHMLFELGEMVVIIAIIIPLFITLGDKNYGNTTVKNCEIQKFKTPHIYLQ